MRTLSIVLTAIAGLVLVQCGTDVRQTPDFSSVSRVDSGTAVSVMLTSYSTTLLANGDDGTRLRIAVSDSVGREITSATDSGRVYVSGDGTITELDGTSLPVLTDTAGVPYTPARLVDGVRTLAFKAGTSPDRVKVEARSGTLFPGSHEIHTIPGDVRLLTPTAAQLPTTTKPFDRMIGADISFLPQIENGAGRFFQGGEKFFEDGQEVDAIELLKNHGFNSIRLRIFVNPKNEKGYSPGVGFCGLDSTLSVARRIKDAGLGFLLDFHYSDYWADPQQQNKPLAWADLDYETLKDSVRSYTTAVLRAMEWQGTLPDMVQIGNEINHGLLWPEGHIGNLDQLAGLLQAGVEGTSAVNPDMPVMMHIALGGQNAESRFWLDNMIARGVTFDIIGISYYPRWHGTLEDLYSNLHDLIDRYNKPVNIVEYSDFKREVHDIVFNLPNDLGKGTAIWEPLGWRSRAV
ncbi:MAG: glycosyl hydrolase 53 family protein [Gemmatimonadota bacterium]|nr:glycosyl hydrolase 53 family protein [Gemmatimonadota bacterium]MDH3477771.1 glycosyl hydrolase 53 family protein [Gemmatimonadota bacterium]MDH3569074.1 glycosyl hydrolase 53 family protein [Gemmatimonadota bacterium]